MPGKGSATEIDLLEDDAGGCRRHAEFAEELKPLRSGEQRPRGDLREDVVERTVDVREKDCHRFAPTGGPVQEQLDGHCR